MKKAEIKQRFKELIANRKTRVALKVTICVLAALCIFRLFLLVFPVRQFEIEGDTHYELNDIVNAAQIRSGSRIYAMNKSKAEKKILDACSHIKEVKIKRKFPNTVCFEIEERVAGWYIQIGTDFYALDYDLNVLMETQDEEDLKIRGLTKLILPELESVIIGTTPKFGQSDELLITESLKIIDQIRTHKVKSRLTYLDISNRFEIKLTVDETYEVRFGDINEANTKFAMIDKIIEESSSAGYAGGEINVINPLAHSFRGYLVEVEEPGETEETSTETTVG